MTRSDLWQILRSVGFKLTEGSVFAPVKAKRRGVTLTATEHGMDESGAEYWRFELESQTERANHTLSFIESDAEKLRERLDERKARAG